MAQWYHRNALKSTSPNSFTLGLSSAHPTSMQICSALSKSRSKILEMVADPGTNVTSIQTQVRDYLSLLKGFVFCHDLDPNFSSLHSSKLRHMITFKWSNSVTGMVDVCCRFKLNSSFLFSKELLKSNKIVFLK